MSFQIDAHVEGDVSEDKSDERTDVDDTKLSS